MTDSYPVFKEFISTCSTLLKGENAQFLGLIKKRYNNCSESFRHSEGMVDLLNSTMSKLMSDSKRIFVHLKDFVTELKAWSSEGNSQSSRKRKAEHPVEAVSKLVRIEDSTSDCSDMEGKLHRALGSGGSLRSQTTSPVSDAMRPPSASSQLSDRSQSSLCGETAAVGWDSSPRATPDFASSSAKTHMYPERVDSPKPQGLVLASVAVKHELTETVRDSSSVCQEIHTNIPTHTASTSRSPSHSGHYPHGALSPRTSSHSYSIAQTVDQSTGRVVMGDRSISQTEGSNSGQCNGEEAVDSDVECLIVDSNPQPPPPRKTEDTRLRITPIRLPDLDLPSSSLASPWRGSSGSSVRHTSSHLATAPSHSKGKSLCLTIDRLKDKAISSQMPRPGMSSHLPKPAMSHLPRATHPSYSTQRKRYACSDDDEIAVIEDDDDVGYRHAAKRVNTTVMVRKSPGSPGASGALRRGSPGRSSPRGSPGRSSPRGSPGRSSPRRPEGRSISPRQPEPSTSRGRGGGMASRSPTPEEESRPKTKEDRNVKRLEKLLEKIRDEIERVREKELTLDDLNRDNSSYIYEDRLQKKFIKVWDRLCKLKGRSTSSGRPIERKFKYQGTRYPEINHKIEKFVNRSESFPDYHDIKGIIKKVNIRNKLRLNVMQINSISKETFMDVGESLQRRRQEDFISTFHSKQTMHCSSELDPALFDEELRRKLEANQRIAMSNLEGVIRKYTDLQLAGAEAEKNDKEESESDEDPVSDHNARYASDRNAQYASDYDAREASDEDVRSKSYYGPESEEEVGRRSKVRKHGRVIEDEREDSEEEEDLEEEEEEEADDGNMIEEFIPETALELQCCPST